MRWGRHLRLFLCLPLAAAALAPGCTNVPELDATVPGWARDADYPMLIPLTGDLASVPAPQGEAERLQDALKARSARLQRRARELQGPVLDDTARDRITRGVTR